MKVSPLFFLTRYFWLYHVITLFSTIFIPPMPADVLSDIPLLSDSACCSDKSVSLRYLHVPTFPVQPLNLHRYLQDVTQTNDYPVFLHANAFIKYKWNNHCCFDRCRWKCTPVTWNFKVLQFCHRQLPGAWSWQHLHPDSRRYQPEHHADLHRQLGWQAECPPCIVVCPVTNKLCFLFGCAGNAADCFGKLHQVEGRAISGIQNYDLLRELMICNQKRRSSLNIESSICRHQLTILNCKTGYIWNLCQTC